MFRFRRLEISAITFFLATLLAVAAAGDGAVEPQIWRRGLFRVNTEVSAGLESFDTVAAKAGAAGLEFVVFTDQFLVVGEYGLPPFRNVLKSRRERKSILTFGIDNYLAAIGAAAAANPRVVLVPGADIAPHYHWSGSWWRGDLRANNWSRQLSVFGPPDAEFYRRLPVVLNTRPGWRFPETFIRLIPMALGVLGAMVFIGAGGRPLYQDRQGNMLIDRRGLWFRRCLGTALAAGGIAWTVDNRPFTVGDEFSVHRDEGLTPILAVCEYVSGRRTRSGDVGLFWSAPEATMDVQMEGVSLLTKPYLDDITATDGHNGHAGVYGDVFTAHRPGGVWDGMLLDYCRGVRAVRPVVVGEADYKGTNPIDLLQTVIHLEKLDLPGVVGALVAGRSYALYRGRGGTPFISHASLAAAAASAALGETLAVPDGETVSIRLAGGILANDPAAPPTKAILTIVVNGELFHSAEVGGEEFCINLEVDRGLQRPGLNYLRFHLNGGHAGWLIANPVFFTIKPEL